MPSIFIIPSVTADTSSPAGSDAKSLTKLRHGLARKLGYFLSTTVTTQASSL